MEFIYPTVLFSLFATAIPVLIHLLDWQKPTPIAFTNVKFLKEINQKSNKSRQVKNWLILLCRILFLVFLIFAFAQPFFKTEENPINNQQIVAIYADNSYSMEHKNGNHSLFDLIIKEIDKIPSLFPSTTRFLFTDNGLSFKDKQLLEGEKLRERITETKFAPISRNLQEIYNQQIKIKEKIGSNNPVSLIWMSDFQKSTLGNLNDLKLDSTIQIYLLPVQNTEKQSQISLDSIWLENMVLKSSDNNKIFIKFKNQGKTGAKSVPIKLYLDDIQTAATTLDVEPNESKILNFDFQIPANTNLKGKITIDDKNLSFDNTFYFSLNLTNDIHILGISDLKSDIMESVFKNESIFKYKEKSFGQMSSGDLNNVSLVIVNGMDKLSQSELDLLNEFQQNQGSLFVLPSPDYEKCDNQWENNLHTETFKLSPNWKNEKSYQLQFPNLKNPFFSKIFENNTNRPEMPAAKTLIIANRNENILLKTENEKPFLVEYAKPNNHHLYICTSPLEEGFSTWFQHAIFVPIMYNMAFSSAQNNFELAYFFNQKNKEITTKNTKSDIKYHLKGENNYDNVPNQYIREHKLIMDMPTENIQSGFYQLTYKDSLVQNIALNYPKSESNLETYSIEELQNHFKKFKNVKIIPSIEQKGIENSMPDLNKNIPLWKYCIVIALFFLLAEILLLRFYKKSRQ